MNSRLLKAVRREQRKGATVEVIREKIDVTLGPMAYFDKNGRVIGGSRGDDYRQFVEQLDLRITRPDGTILVPVGDSLVVANR